KQLNQKSVEVTDLNAQLQEKVFVITTLKDDLRKLKRKDIVDNAAQISNAATIAPGMYKLDPVILALKVKNNMEAYEYYLKHTMEQAAILREQLNQKSVEVTDLNAQLQEKVFVITTLKDDLRKLKRKDIVDNAAQISNAATIAPGMYKLDPVILALKVKNNMEAYEYYLKHTMEQATILRE
nr:hypothetical protein [Tanacetum cinerariifolium]